MAEEKIVDVLAIREPTFNIQYENGLIRKLSIIDTQRSLDRMAEALRKKYFPGDPPAFAGSKIEYEEEIIERTREIFGFPTMAEARGIEAENAAAETKRNVPKPPGDYFIMHIGMKFREAFDELDVVKKSQGTTQS
jgi:hypothetical protein